MLSIKAKKNLLKNILKISVSLLTNSCATLPEGPAQICQISKGSDMASCRGKDRKVPDEVNGWYIVDPDTMTKLLLKKY